MPNLLKKLLFSLLASLILFISTAPYFAVKAQQEPLWYNQDFKTWSQKVNDESNPTEIFGERYTAAQVEWVVWGLINFLFTQVLPHPVVGCVFSNTVDLNSCKTAIQSMMASTLPQSNLASSQKSPSLISAVFDTSRPFSGIGYIKNRINNFSLVPVAHAQTGVGYTALATVQTIWIQVRNVSYALFALIAVVFAFMIMFRVKLSPQTAISVQSALPKIIIGLILVTFSYAIAGLLIDLMYVVIGLVSVFTSSMIPAAPSIMNPRGAYDPPAVFQLLTIGAANSVGGILGLMMMYLQPFLLLAFVILIVAGIVAALATASISLWIGIGIFVVVLVVAIWVTIKIIWVLFKAFANIILLTIFAPIQLTIGIAIPNFGFNQWFRSFISNLSVFVVTGVLWLFAWIFMLDAWSLAFPDGNLTLAVGGNVVNAWPPLLGTGSGAWNKLLFLGVSFVLFTMIPKSTELVQALLSGKPFAYGSGIGEALAPLSYGWSRLGAPLFSAAQRSREDEYVGSTLGWLRTRMENAGLTGVANRIGVRAPPNMAKEMHELTEELRRGKS